MNKVNYDAEMLRIKAKVEDGTSLLLHSCCAPCSSYCLTQVADKFKVTVLYYNPNLDTEAEYRHRKEEQIRLLKETGTGDILDCDFECEDFSVIAKGHEKDKEGGARCYLCYALRLERTAKEAKKHGFEYFATTLTVSPLKNAEWLNEIGFRMAEKYGVKFLPTDFKKRGGYLESVKLSKEYGLYRQNYCGCAFSKAEAEEREKNKN